jgi:hypothetical protein
MHTRTIRFRVVCLLAALGLLAGCSGRAATSAGQGPAASPGARATSPAGHSADSKPPSTPPSGSSAGTAPQAAATAHYLALAEATFRGQSRPVLVSRGHAFCRSLQSTRSLDDVVGDLTSQIGSQPAAYQLVTAAAAAYCPGASRG